jgi:hypothetical protein
MHPDRGEEVGVGIEALLFPALPNIPSNQRPVPDGSAAHRDLRRPNVTLERIPRGDKIFSPFME